MRLRSRGDTIVEVMIAFVVFSSIAVGAIAIMNQGTATAQKALEITLVRQQIDAQAETIRYMHDKYISAKSNGGVVSDDWQRMINTNIAVGKGLLVPPAEASDFGATPEGCPDIPSHAFALNVRTASIIDRTEVEKADVSSLPYAQVKYDDSPNPIVLSSTGLWVESVGEPSQDYIDFNIRACWYAPGSGLASTIGTIVRLHVPR